MPQYLMFAENVYNKIKDVSLIPPHNSEGEYILWLAGFIEKITEGGPKPPPPIKKFIPEYMSFELK